MSVAQVVLPDDMCGLACGDGNPGDPCDDGDNGTQNDVYQDDCTCKGAPLNFPYNGLEQGSLLVDFAACWYACTAATWLHTCGEQRE